jgi:hypothetical protein
MINYKLGGNCYDAPIYVKVNGVFSLYYRSLILTGALRIRNPPGNLLLGVRMSYRQEPQGEKKDYHYMCIPGFYLFYKL